ncbi:MAG: hypothetical protein D8M52_04485 [Chlorobi bacterium]|nr:MAG: tyrosine-type recombinase/integrase [Bacteroidota bacterium]MBL1160961.1 hypothetical protein [Chlorobiota bacterium]
MASYSGRVWHPVWHTYHWTHMPKVKNQRFHVGSGDDTIHITFPFKTKKGSQNGSFRCYATCRRWVTSKNPDGRVRHATGIIMPVEYWDNGKNDIRGTYRNREAVRSRLNTIVDRIRNAYMAAESNRVGRTVDALLSEKDVISLIDGKTNILHHGKLPLFVRHKDKEDTYKFGGLLGEFMRNYVSNDGRKLAEMESHYKNYQTLAYNLELFLDRYYPFGFTIDRIEEELPKFSKSWFRYLIHDKDDAGSSIDNVTKRLRQVLKWAGEQKYITPVSTKPLGFSYTKYPLTALPEEILSKFYNHRFLPTEGRLERVRDAFVLMCLTALRFENFWHIDEAVITDDAIHIETMKDRGSVTIPLFPATRELLAKYPAGLKSIEIANQNFNNYVKEAAESAGLTSEVVVRQYRGDRTVQHRHRLCDVMASHTGRRTLVSICRARGIPDEIIMKITGHKNLAQLRTYTSIPDIEVLYAFGKERDESSSFRDPMFTLSGQWRKAA